MNIETCQTSLIQAVQIPALGNQFIVQKPQPMSEERLPALEVVVAIQELREPTSVKLPINPKLHHANHDKPALHSSTSIPGQLSLSHSLRIKSAEFWLILGEADEALRELEALPGRAWNHPSAKKVCVAALRVLDERTGQIVEWRKRLWRSTKLTRLCSDELTHLVHSTEVCFLFPSSGVRCFFGAAAITKGEVEASGGRFWGYPFLAKPFVLTEVLACLQHHLGG